MPRWSTPTSNLFGDLDFNLIIFIKRMRLWLVFVRKTGSSDSGHINNTKQIKSIEVSEKGLVTLLGDRNE
jgi:hypothetical protein